MALKPASSASSAEQTSSAQRRALEITVIYGDSVLDVRHLVGSKSFIIGEGKAADLTLSSDDLPASEFPLVRSIGGRFVITFVAEQRGEIERDGAFHPLAWLKNSANVQRDEALSGCFRYPLPVDERATLRFGGLTITLRYVSPPDKVEKTREQREARYGTWLLALSASLAVVLGAGLMLSFRPELADTSAFLTQNPRVARLLGQTSSADPIRVGRVVLDTAPIVTGFDPHDATLRVAAEADAIDACVSGLEPGSGLRASLEVDALGNVTGVGLEPVKRGQSEDGGDCVRQALGRVRFPASAAGGRVVYTIGVR